MFDTDAYEAAVERPETDPGTSKLVGLLLDVLLFVPTIFCISLFIATSYLVSLRQVQQLPKRVKQSHDLFGQGVSPLESGPR